MIAPRRFLICRGFSNTQIEPRSVEELASLLQQSMPEREAQRMAAEAWEKGRAEHGLIEIERRWA